MPPLQWRLDKAPAACCSPEVQLSTRLRSATRGLESFSLCQQPAGCEEILEAGSEDRKLDELAKLLGLTVSAKPSKPTVSATLQYLSQDGPTVSQAIREKHGPQQPPRLAEVAVAHRHTSSRPAWSSPRCFNWVSFGASHQASACCDSLGFFQLGEHFQQVVRNNY